VKSATSNKQVRGNGKIGGRYYVQRLTEQVFVIREKTDDGESGPDDRIVRSFVFRHDAYMYVDSMNEKQKNLDDDHDRQAQSTN
jgi:hypothetical protein